MGVKRKALAAAGVLTGAAKGSSTGEDGPSSSAVESRVVYIGHLPHGFFEKQLLSEYGNYCASSRGAPVQLPPLFASFSRSEAMQLANGYKSYTH